MKYIFLLLSLAINICIVNTAKAQRLSPDNTDYAVQLFNAEKQLIIKNQQISKEQKASFLADYGLIDEALNQIKTSEPSFAYYLANAKINFKSHQYKSAIKNVNQALALKPENRESLLLSGEVYLALNDIEKAINSANTRLAKVDFDDKALVLLAKTAIAQTNFDKALGHIQEAISHNPNNADALYLNAYINLKTKSKKKENTLEKALELNPYHSEARFLYGLILSTKDIELAKKQWQIALLKDPFNEKVHQTIISFSEKDQVFGKSISNLLNEVNPDKTLITDLQKDKSENEKSAIDLAFDFRKSLYHEENLTGFYGKYLSSIHSSDVNPILSASVLEFIAINELLDIDEQESLSSFLQNSEASQILSLAPIFDITQQNEILLKVINKSFEDNQIIINLLTFANIKLKPSLHTSSDDFLPLYKILDAATGKDKMLKEGLVDILSEKVFPKAYKVNFRQFVLSCAKPNTQISDDYFNLAYSKFLEGNDQKSCSELNQYFNELDNILFKGEPQKFTAFQAQALIYNAEMQINKGNFTIAEQVLDQALQTNNTYTPVYLTKTKLCLIQGKFEEAEVWWKSAEQMDVNNPDVYKIRAQFSIQKFNQGRIPSEQALELASIEFAKALQLETDPYLFGKTNRDIQELYQLFAKPYQALELAESYLSAKANNANQFEKIYITETSAFIQSVRTLNGYGTSLISRAQNIINTSKNNSEVQDMIWLAYSYLNPELLDSLRFNNLSVNVKHLASLENLETNEKPFAVLSDFSPVSTKEEIIYLKHIEYLIDVGKIETANELMSDHTFSKYPEVWSRYNMVRGKLLLKNNESKQAVDAFNKSLEISKYQHESRKLLITLFEGEQKKYKQDIKNMRKDVRKLELEPGPDFTFYKFL
ncbi:tetratricopeptide repeat protein [Chondrinema litorale]|uniref:tetratricopeptide repeat protein n=1 Tax=Chondrinema litorale TaxID=2994555 RepID=UPI0025428211|nr:tetratricopeptide repeat protein [Chondrinema litorale]UZR94044.1 tetratricopeptide repeat protein [Chondrinema litorale]